MKKKVLISGGIILGFILLFLLFSLIKRSNINIVVNGNIISYQVGHLDENNNAIIEEKFIKHLEFYGKYLISGIMIDSNNKFHCIVPILQITDNKSTIWSLFSTKYFIEFPIILLSNKGDTINSLISMQLKKKNKKLFISIILRKQQVELIKIPVCDPVFIKPCMIKKN